MMSPSPKGRHNSYRHTCAVEKHWLGSRFLWSINILFLLFDLPLHPWSHLKRFRTANSYTVQIGSRHSVVSAANNRSWTTWSSILIVDICAITYIRRLFAEADEADDKTIEDYGNKSKMKWTKQNEYVDMQMKEEAWRSPTTFIES